MGGEPGSRLSDRLAMPVSGDTLIDDWAWRKGQRYGTIICDLERNRVLDLLRRTSSPATASSGAAS
ncbi:hypothetical protein NKI72_29015 [Mesorhizobium sp. M0437]|uniref:hypothetical protein n=1 Tax=Mesorhizobium sp. M0437 TaxID=2956945 RepID=UPI00333E06E1